MADENENKYENKGTSTPVLAFAIGGLVVAVAILAYFIFGGDAPTTDGSGGDTNISVETSDTSSGEGSGDSEPGAETSGGAETGGGADTGGGAETESTGQTSN